jgi:hypothetical protein
MLAPPNHGSALAQLGKSRLSRMKFWLDGVEPGQSILDWLELGSDESWQLAKRELGRRALTCVVTGASPDRGLYDHLNSYTGEHGSDGVVRIPAANPNYTWLQLTQSGGNLRLAASQRSPNTLTYFLNYAALARIHEFGFILTPRPNVGPYTTQPPNTEAHSSCVLTKPPCWKSSSIGISRKASSLYPVRDTVLASVREVNHQPDRHPNE